MDIIKVLIAIFVVLFFAFQIYGLVKDIINKHKKKKLKEEVQEENKNKENKD